MSIKMFVTDLDANDNDGVAKWIEENYYDHEKDLIHI